MSRLEDVLEQEIKLYQKDIREMHRELRRYKLLEAELGIDLITLFKALKDGIEVGNDKMRVCVKNCKLIYREEDNEYAFIYDYYLIKLKDYGKIWALARNDLEEQDDD